MTHTYPLDEVKFPIQFENDLSTQTGLHKKRLFVLTTIFERSDPIVDYYVTYTDLQGDHKYSFNQLRPAVDYYNAIQTDLYQSP